MQGSQTPTPADETPQDPGRLRLISTSNAGLPQHLADRVDGHLATFAERRLGGRRDGLFDLLADRLQPSRVAAGGQPRQHARHDALCQQIRRGKRLVGAQSDLLGVWPDGAHPRPLDRHAPAAQGHRTALGAVPGRGLLRIVAALGAGDLVDLGGQQSLVHVLHVTRGKIVAVDILANPERLGRLDLAAGED